MPTTTGRRRPATVASLAAALAFLGAAPAHADAATGPTTVTGRGSIVVINTTNTTNSAYPSYASQGYDYDWQGWGRHGYI